MPSKPSKCDRKIFWLCETSLPYTLKAKINVGRQPRSAPKKNLSQNIAVHLTAPLQGSEGTYRWTTFFTGIPLDYTLL